MQERERCLSEVLNYESRPMQRALLISILLATLVVPIWNTKQRDLARGLKRTVVQMAMFIAAWTLACMYLYWHI